MQHKLFIFLSILISVYIAFLFTFPRYTEQDDVNMLQKYLTIKHDLLSFMTFNICVDILEHDSNNHFTKRIYSLTKTVEKWQPAILSVQEPFTDQLRLGLEQFGFSFDLIYLELYEP